MPYEEHHLEKENLSEFAQRTAEKNMGGSFPEVEAAKQFKDGGNCPDCGVKLKTHTAKSGMSYLMADPAPNDFCKHKTEDGKCAQSWADHPKKGSKGSPKGRSTYSQDFPLTSTDLIEFLTSSNKIQSSALEKYIEMGRDNTVQTLARFTGCLSVCEKLGNKNAAFVGMIFKIGEKVE